MNSQDHYPSKGDYDIRDEVLAKAEEVQKKGKELLASLKKSFDTQLKDIIYLIDRELAYHPFRQVGIEISLGLIQDCIQQEKIDLAKNEINNLLNELRKLSQNEPEVKLKKTEVSKDAP